MLPFYNGLCDNKWYCSLGHFEYHNGCWVSMTKFYLIMTKIYLMFLFLLKNSNKLEQAVSKVSWLWPHYCGKGAEQSDLQ